MRRREASENGVRLGDSVQKGRTWGGGRRKCKTNPTEESRKKRSPNLPQSKDDEEGFSNCRTATILTRLLTQFIKFKGTSASQPGKFDRKKNLLNEEISPCGASYFTSTKNAEAPGAIAYSDLTVGIVREPEWESRVPQVPDSVEALVENYGIRVVVEKGLGSDHAELSDDLYEDAGAEIAFSSGQVYREADVILRLAVPSIEDVEEMSRGDVSTLLSFLYPSFFPEVVDRLAEERITSFGVDCAPQISSACMFDSLIGPECRLGEEAVKEAAGYLRNQKEEEEEVKKTVILVIGAGYAGLSAIQAARDGVLGSQVDIRGFDFESGGKDMMESAGVDKFLSVEQKLEEEEYNAEMKRLFVEQAKEVDLIITPLGLLGLPAPLLISDDIVEVMKPGSVIVDLSASCGGNVESTRPGEVFVTRNGVAIIGNVEDPMVLSSVYSDSIRALLLCLGDQENGVGSFYVDVDDEFACQGTLVTHDGELKWPHSLVESSTNERKSADSTVRPELLRSFRKVLVWSALFAGGCWGLRQSLGMIGHHTWILGRYLPIVALGLAGLVSYRHLVNIPPTHHSPLIAMTNAISGLMVCGGLLLIPEAVEQHPQAAVLAASAVFASSINLFGSFLVTRKMLAYLQERVEPKEESPGWAYGVAALTSFAAYFYAYLFGSGVGTFGGIGGTAFLATVACILSIGGMCRQEMASVGNMLGVFGCTFAVGMTLSSLGLDSTIAAKMMTALIAMGGSMGLFVAAQGKPTDLPQMIALFHSFVGLSACFLSLGCYLCLPSSIDLFSLALGTYFGGVTFAGSLVAFMKLQSLVKSDPISLPLGRASWNFGLTIGALGLSGYFSTIDDIGVGLASLVGITALSVGAGAHLIGATAGENLPVAMSVLTSYSGWSLCAEGFLLDSKLLSFVGGVVGATGAILAKIMCKQMRRSVLDVFCGK